MSADALFMMNYKVKDTYLELSDGHLSINGQVVDLNHKTLLCIALLIQSRNQPVSKDQLLSHVWQGSIVSDSSIFKQIQAARKVLENHGLPGDVIESIYGTGYKIKYRIETVSEAAIPVAEAPNKTTYVPVLFAITVMTFLGLVILLHHRSEPIPNQLSKQKRTQLESQLKQNWADGLAVINDMLTDQQNNPLSQQDLSYLFLKKAEAELQLQQSTEAIHSSEQAIKHAAEKDLAQLTKSHLVLARAFSSNDQTSKAVQTMDQAIAMLGTDKQSSHMVDALMTKALLLRKLGRFDDSISINQQSLDTAEAIGDAVGKLIAVNNMATTYQQNGDTDKAIELSQVGLQLALTNGSAQHIANAYNALATLELETDNFAVATEYVEQALKYQISSNNIRFLAPKLYNYLYIAIHTQSPETTDPLFDTALLFLEKVDASEATKGQFNYLQSLDYAMQGDWHQAQAILNQAAQQLLSSSLNAFKNKVTALNALVNYHNQNHIKAIELAKQVLEHKGLAERPALMANLTLMFTYTALNQPELAQAYVSKTQDLHLDSWVFETSNYVNSSLEQPPELPNRNARQGNTHVTFNSTIIHDIIGLVEHLATKAAHNNQQDSELEN